MFHPMNLEDYPMYLEDLCIIHLKYLKVHDSFDVLGRFVNLYIMVILKDLLAFLDNGHYVCFMITIIKDLLAFLDKGHFGCFMITIMQYVLAFLDTCIRSL